MDVFVLNIHSVVSLFSPLTSGICIILVHLLIKFKLHFLPESVAVVSLGEFPLYITCFSAQAGSRKVQCFCIQGLSRKLRQGQSEYSRPNVENGLGTCQNTPLLLF